MLPGCFVWTTGAQHVTLQNAFPQISSRKSPIASGDTQLNFRTFMRICSPLRCYYQVEGVNSARYEKSDKKKKAEAGERLLTKLDGGKARRD